MYLNMSKYAQQPLSIGNIRCDHGVTIGTVWPDYYTDGANACMDISHARCNGCGRCNLALFLAVLSVYGYICINLPASAFSSLSVANVFLLAIPGCEFFVWMKFILEWKHCAMRNYAGQIFNPLHHPFVADSAPLLRNVFCLFLQSVRRRRLSRR